MGGRGSRSSRRAGALLVALLVVVPGCHLDPADAERDPFVFPEGIVRGPAVVRIPFDMGWAFGMVAGLPFVALTYPVSLAWTDEGSVGEGYFRQRGGFTERQAVQLYPTTAVAWFFGLVAAGPFYLVSLPLRPLMAEPVAGGEPPTEAGEPTDGPSRVEEYLPRENERD